MAVAREGNTTWVARSGLVEQREGTKDGRLDNKRDTLHTPGSVPTSSSLTATATHPHCDLATVSVVIDELETTHRDR